MELVDNPRTTAAKLGEVISVDPALAAKVLKIANSAFYGFPAKIGTINLAVVVLGFLTLKHLCLSVGIIDVVSANEASGGFSLKRFWRHSIEAAVAAQVIARSVRYRITGEAFVAGLIHDIGKLIMSQKISEEYKAVIAEVKATCRPMHVVEEEMLGVTHCDVGAWLTHHWNLPPELVEAVAVHHSPGVAEVNPRLAIIVYAANILAHHVFGGRSAAAETNLDEALSVVADCLNVGHDQVTEDLLIPAYNEEVEKSTLFFDLPEEVDSLSKGENRAPAERA